MTASLAPVLSVLMPARNAEAFISDAVASVAERCPLAWELLVVDDRSTDATAAVCRGLVERWPQVRLLANPGAGKVSALNSAFAACRGGLVTTLDSDDCLPAAYWRYLAGSDLRWDAMCRDYLLVDESLRALGAYHVSRRFFDAGFEEVLDGLVSLPRACWTVQRHVAERIFPVPADLPFEDVWFSLVIKRYAAAIEHPRRAMYLYRQHPGQTYGGVLNYGPGVTVFRAGRLLEYARSLPRHAARLGIVIGGRLDRTARYFETLSRRHLPLGSLLKAPLPAREKGSIFLLRRLWPLMSSAKRLQWAVDGLRRRAGAPRGAGGR